MKKLVFSFFIIFLTFLLQNCGPKEDTRPTIYMDQTSIDYCVFDAGSWWVYEEVITGELDTIKVTYVNRYLLDDDEKYSVKRDGYGSKYTSTKYKKLSSRCGVSISKLEDINSIEYFGEFPYLYDDLCFTNSIDSSYKIDYYSGQKIQFWDSLNQIKIGKHEFKDIRIFENSIGLYSSYQKTIYWARHVGKIKIKRADGTTWNLIDFKVSQENL
jgi:hypothetical protein